MAKPKISQSHIHTFFTQELAVQSGDFTYFGIYGDDGCPGVAKYDNIKKTIQIGSPRKVPIDRDDHNNPSVTVLENGKILLCYSNHPGACWAAISKRPHDVTEWIEYKIYDGVTYNNSYAHTHQTPDAKKTIFWFFRDGTANTKPIAFRINQSGGDPAGWTPNANIIKLIQNPSNRPYFRVAQDGLRLDICYTDGQPNEATTNSLYHVYLTLDPSGDKFSVYKSDNTLIDTWNISGGTGLVNGKTLPLNVSDGTKIYDGNPNRAWVWDTQWVDGNLYCLYPVFYDSIRSCDVHLYRIARYNGTSWTSQNICYAGDSSDPTVIGRVPHWIYPDNDISQPQYSPGLCLDPNIPNRVFLGKKYGPSDVRIEQWDCINNVWSKTADITGEFGNGMINARPFPVKNSNPSNIVWWSARKYPSYFSFETDSIQSLIPIELAKTKKETNPVWNPEYAPIGTKAYYLISEGSGNVVRDLAGSFDGAIVGSVLWGSDVYGPCVSGFSPSSYISIDNLAKSACFDSGSYPKWINLFYKSKSPVLTQYPVAFGNSKGNEPIFGITVNNSATGQVGCNYRDSSNISNQISTPVNVDDNYHSAMIIVESPSNVMLYSDGHYKGSATNLLKTVSFDTFNIGLLKRLTNGNAAVGCIISAVQVGTGLVPSPAHLHVDAINGQFAGTWQEQTNIQNIPDLHLCCVSGIFNQCGITGIFGNNNTYYINNLYINIV